MVRLTPNPPEMGGTISVETTCAGRNKLLEPADGWSTRGVLGGVAVLGGGGRVAGLEVGSESGEGCILIAGGQGGMA